MARIVGSKALSIHHPQDFLQGPSAWELSPGGCGFLSYHATAWRGIHARELHELKFPLGFKLQGTNAGTANGCGHLMKNGLGASVQFLGYHQDSLVLGSQQRPVQGKAKETSLS